MYIKAELSVLIINKMSVYCPARITVEPLIDGLIYGRKVNGRNRFWINRDVEVNEKTYLEWQIIPNSWKAEHSEYCQHQIQRISSIFSRRKRLGTRHFSCEFYLKNLCKLEI